jgi:predicted Zn-ribbon and HTH transcriptional regulator
MALVVFPCHKEREERLKQVKFTVHKLNRRPRPKRKEQIKIVSCFSEFGCEVLGVLYSLPKLIRRFPGCYIVVMGWYGREYLYRHLVDEFWEIGEEYMWLRDYCRAFHNISKNLSQIEKEASWYGDVITASALGKYAVSNFCRTCGNSWHEWRKKITECPKCKSTDIINSIFTDVVECKKNVRRVPKPSSQAIEFASKIVKPNMVGVFARNRKTYGRNLPADFYVKLVKLLRDKGYEPIWLGEKQNSLACPVEDVVDFSRMVESKDLEKTLAIISQLKFTIQFWTASTRLAGLMGIPFILFESPEQIYNSYSGIMGAQEGKRLEVCTFGPKKIVLAHYFNVLENQDKALNLLNQAIIEVEQGDYKEILGMVEDRDFSILLQQEFKEMLT